MLYDTSFLNALKLNRYISNILMISQSSMNEANNFNV